jgi:hypothetical protein
MEIPLFSPTVYELYKIVPFPVIIRKEESTYGYIGFNKDVIFSDPLRQHYGKMTANELTKCFQPYELVYVCKEDIPILTYVPEADCEATLLHPSTTDIPDNCEYRFFRLSQTFWIPLHDSNLWLFVTPQPETLTVLCPQGTTTVKLQDKGKLSLDQGCKGYSSYVILYASSTLTTNLTDDYIPSASIDFDCCFDGIEKVNFEDLPLHIPLVNIMSNTDELRLASIKADEIQRMIKDQESKQNDNLYLMATSWGTTLGTICLIITCICCSCCCCKCCRNCFFWFWRKCNPKACWQETQEKCCINIHNYNGSRVVYAKTNTSPAISMQSLPELECAIQEQPKRELNEQVKIAEGFDSISKRTRSKRMFR